jgi:RNA polymerase sigma-70 factor (ECF subfamily)
VERERDELDREALERIKGGEREAFRAIVERYQDPLHQFVRSFLGGPRDAEDLTQEVFIQAFRSLGKFRGDSKFSTWLYSIARFVCLHEIRRRKGAKTEPADPQSEAFASLPEPSESHQTRLEREERSARLREAVDSLSQAHRPVIVLAFWENMSYPEIASVLDIPVGTVKSRAHNAIAALLKKVGPLLEPAEDKP